MSLTDLTLTELQAKLKSREVSAREATAAYLQRIAATNRAINAYLTVCDDTALAEADAADARIAAGDAAPLTGIPLALKDIFLTEGTRTTCASKILDNFVAPYDATAVARLKQQGAVLLGKLNMDEFAMGSSNENSAFGATRNPWATDCVPGGSSGGSAAAVAARLAAATLGTDTGGSIRQPAATAASSASSRPTAACRATASSPTPRRSTRSGRWREPSRTARCCSTASPATTRSTRPRSTSPPAATPQDWAATSRD